jgi:hypothetical protein
MVHDRVIAGFMEPYRLDGRTLTFCAQFGPGDAGRHRGTLSERPEHRQK